VDSKIDFNWSGGSPDVTINPDYFTARWTGEILPQFTEAYTFYLKTDDGARLWIDDKLLIDKWAPQQATEWSGSINLTADQRYKIKVEYFELIGDATVVLQWSSTKTPKQVVPTSQLFSSPITGIEEIGSAFDIQLYPQPADKSVTVEVSSKLAYDYEIYDTVGRTIQKGLLNPEKNEINIETLPCGVYIIRSQSINRKFIKK
jgi:hypothetical protein